MSDIQIGDKVTWMPKYQSKKIPKTLIGEVVKLYGGRKPWAAVWVDIVDKPGFWCIDLNRLTRVADSDPVAAQDKHDALGAAEPPTGSMACPPARAMAGLVEDYDEVMLREAGNLGGVEL